jgi:hypothetical protein
MVICILLGEDSTTQTVDLELERSDQSIFWIFGFRYLIDLVVPQVSWFLGRADLC